MPTMTKAGYVPPKPEKPAKPPRHEPKPRKKKKKRRANAAAVASLAVFLIAALVGAATIYIYTSTQPYLHTFVPGTMLMGYPLAGATREDALALLEDITGEEIAAWSYELTYNEQTYALSAQDMALHVDTAATLDPLWAAGREGGMLSRYIQMLRMKSEPVIMRPVIRHSMDAADVLLEQIRADVEREPADAAVSFRPGSATPFAFTDEVVGLALDTQPLRAAIEEAVTALQSGSAEIVPQEIQPHVYRAELENAITLRVRTVMPITGDEAAQSNVRLAVEWLNGVTIAPGESLSFNETVGRRTAETGYLPAAEPAYGDDVSGVGGGVCQASTALYRTALLAGMTVSQRSAAVRPVDYCDMGQEAVVSDQGLDLVIGNPTDTPLFVMARVYEDGGRAYIELSVIGEPLAKRYMLISQTDELGLIEEPVYIRDREGKYATYTDERVPVSEAKMGYACAVSLVTVGEDGAELEREIISEDTYESIPPAIYVGVTEREKTKDE